MKRLLLTRHRLSEATQLADEVERFRFCPPDADPVEQTAVTYRFKHLAKKFLFAAGRLGDSEIDAAIARTNADIGDDLTDAYDLHIALTSVIGLTRELIAASPPVVSSMSPTGEAPFRQGFPAIDRAEWLAPYRDSMQPHCLPCPYEKCTGRFAYQILIERIGDPETARLEARVDKHGRRVSADRASWTLALTYTCETCGGIARGLASYAVRDWHLTSDEGGETPELFRMLWISPAPPVFVIPRRCPQEIAAATREAFELVWHPASCANRVRFALELLADHFRVARTARPRTGGRGARLSLHQRLTRLPSRATKKANVELLEAAKWLGNDGSHGELEPEALMDLLEIYALALEQLFGDHRDKHILRKARSINRKRRR